MTLGEEVFVLRIVDHHEEMKFLCQDKLTIVLLVIRLRPNCRPSKRTKY